ncbi:MAG: hypothetical protein IPQ04_01700 [Saprospiraceae bacterium]|nr:hypothetical protein [Saprospiraceae bacterium]
MEEWQLDFEWLRIRHLVKDKLKQDKLPDLNAILLLIGIQETNIVRPTYSKEEKQDLMHVAVCSLLAQDGYFELEGRDQDGWPHFIQIKSVETQGEQEQETLLKTLAIRYFSTYYSDLFSEQN